VKIIANFPVTLFAILRNQVLGPIPSVRPPQCFGGLLLAAALCLCVGPLPAHGALVLTNYSAANPLKIMPVGDSITDDSNVQNAWRVYLQALLQSNGIPFTFVGRNVSSQPTPGFTETHHEGYSGAVIAPPGTISFTVHGYATTNAYMLKILPDALTKAVPDLFLILMGSNDMGRGRNPHFVATNDMVALLDYIAAHAPNAHIIVGKPTSLLGATYIPSNATNSYGSYSTNIFDFGIALQAVINSRRAQGQKISMADMFSVVNPLAFVDHIHPNARGLQDIASEWLTRIQAITIRTNQVTSVLLPSSSDWKYSDQGLDLGTNWAQPQFDDSGWSHGPGMLGYGGAPIVTTIGYGGNPTNRYTTTYFRSTFVVPDGVCFTNLNFRLAKADGAVVWLNGKELFRTNLPAGSLTYTNRALADVWDEPCYKYFSIPSLSVASVPAGTNLLAVEIHKNSPDKSLLTFDTELIGTGYYLAPAAPALSAALDAGELLLTWPTNSAGYGLESCTDLSSGGAWQSVAGPHSVANTNFEHRAAVAPADRSFFRLYKP
jgi:lysophospholipase L1-like esterase